MSKTKKYLRSLSVGDKVKFGTFWGTKLKWQVAEKNHYGYPDNSVTIVTEEHVATLAFDSAEPYAGSSEMRWYGRGRYKVSNISQWLQSTASAGNWYFPQHSVDHAPARGYVDFDHYEDFCGFLYQFDQLEVDMLMSTTRSVTLGLSFGVGSAESVTSKMFLPTRGEYGDATFARDIIELFRTTSNRKAVLSADALAHAQAIGRGTLTEGENYETLTADGYAYDREKVYHVDTSGSPVVARAYESSGIRPCCNLPADTLISAEPDEDGYYTVIINYPPTEPSPIRLEYADDSLDDGYVRSGRDVTISWGRSTDVDGNFDHYELERQYGDGDFEQIYSGTGRTFTDTAKYGEKSATYRVRGVDDYDLTSEYVVSSTLNIWSNEPPTVSIEDSDLGTFAMMGPTLNYSYSDEDANTITVTIQVDRTTYRTLKFDSTATAQTATFAFTSDEWLKILNGDHTIKVTATDQHGESSTATASFTKSVSKIVFQRMKPVEATDTPTEIIVRVNGEYPENQLTVEVCNNALDDSPTWEDMTAEVIDEEIYVFKNAAKTAENWAVNFRITIDRGTYDGDIYVESVTSNFLAGTSTTSNATSVNSI